MSNSGSKVKVFAIIQLIINIALVIIASVYFFDARMVGYGILVIVVGLLDAYITALIIYCIGESEENTELIISKLNRIESAVVSKNSTSKSISISKLADTGLSKPRYCPDCHKVIYTVRDKCYDCGATLVAPPKNISTKSVSSKPKHCITCGRHVVTSSTYCSECGGALIDD